MKDIKMILKKMLLNYGLVIAISGIIIILEYIFIILNNNIIYNYLFKWIGVIPNVLEYFPIGLNLFHLIKNKISYNFLLIGGIFGLVNTIVWFIWAIQYTLVNKNDPQYHSIVANFLAIILNIVQLYIFYKYKKVNKEILNSIGKHKID